LASNADIVLEALVSRLASIPYSYFYVIGPSHTEVIIYYLFILLLLYRNYLSLDINRIAICGLISANILIFSNILKFPNRSASTGSGQALMITCLDVGHGCAVFIQFPNGKNILYDVGSWKNYDVGKYIAAPFLWSQKIKKIDLVILSHEHEDHWNGLVSLIERFSIKSVFSQHYFFASNTGKNILSVLYNKGISAAALSYGEILKGFEPAVVKILHPPSFASDITTTNDNSCVLKIDYCGHSLLLCADIEEKGIESALLTPSEIRSNIIQIPHHGSLINNLEAFVSAVQPTYAFINTSDNIVSSKTIDILQGYNIITLQPHKEGAVTFTIDKNGITYTTFGK
jgi:competence protein ComEC